MSEDKLKSANLTRLDQWYCLFVGLILALMIVGSAYSLFKLILCATTPPNVPDVFEWASVGGFLGGATRALFTFKHEMAGYWVFR
jgi:hypothetical protein